MHSKYPKGDVRHWQDRLRKVDSPDYSVQIAYKGKRLRFQLETSNKEAAGKKALVIYQTLRASGWEAAIAKYKPELVKAAKGSTVGELLTAVAELANVRPATLRSYQAIGCSSARTGIFIPSANQAAIRIHRHAT